MGYVSLSEVKAASDIKDTRFDARISDLIDAASATLDQVCNRPEGFVAQGVASAKLFAGSGRDYQMIGECVEVTLVEIKRGGTWETLSDWAAFAGDSKFPVYDSLPYTGVLADAASFDASRLPNVRVTARWGYADSVPPQVREACMIWVSRWLKRGQSSYADTLTSDMGGTLEFRRQVDPDVMAILQKGRLIKPTV